MLVAPMRDGIGRMTASAPCFRQHKRLDCERASADCCKTLGHQDHGQIDRSRGNLREDGRVDDRQLRNTSNRATWVNDSVWIAVAAHWARAASMMEGVEMAFDRRFQCGVARDPGARACFV